MTYALAALALALAAALAFTAALVWARCHAVEDWHDSDDARAAPDSNPDLLERTRRIRADG